MSIVVPGITVDTICMNENESSYLASIARLRLVAAKSTHIKESDILEVASLSRQDLQDRHLRHRDWHSAWSTCLDGIPELFAMGGACPDGCWFPRNVRGIVEKLLADNKRLRAELKDKS